MNTKIIHKSLLVAKASLENDRRFVQAGGSDDDAALNHDALFHIEAALREFPEIADPVCSKCGRSHREHSRSSGYLCPGADPKDYANHNWTPLNSKEATTGEFFCPCNEPGPQYFNRDGSGTLLTTRPDNPSKPIAVPVDLHGNMHFTK